MYDDDESIESRCRRATVEELYEHASDEEERRRNAENEPDKVTNLAEYRQRIAEDKQYKEFMDSLSRTPKGVVKKSNYNLGLILAEHPDLSGRFVFNEFTRTIEVKKRLPWRGPGELRETDLTAMAQFISWKELGEYTEAIIHSAIRVEAEKNPYNPIHDYLNGLVWDGVARIDSWMQDYLGAEDSEYSTLVGRCFLISAVARAMRPGCQVDQVVILEGPQGIGKTSAWKALADPWYADTSIDLESKDIFQLISRHWIIELGELDSLSKSERSRIKQFFTVKEDNYRPPYGRVTITQPRQCVFVGTVNDTTYLTDTENRRYLPITCGEINIEGIAADRDQLWAEARMAYEEGQQWYVSHLRDDVREQQEMRVHVDSLQDQVAEFLATKMSVKIFEVFDHLQWSVSQRGRGSEIRIGVLLTRLGWTKRRTMIDGVRSHTYHKSGSTF